MWKIANVPDTISFLHKVCSIFCQKLTKPSKFAQDLFNFAKVENFLQI